MNEDLKSYNQYWECLSIGADTFMVYVKGNRQQQGTNSHTRGARPRQSAITLSENVCYFDTWAPPGDSFIAFIFMTLSPVAIHSHDRAALRAGESIA